ncbi:MAG TPA: MBL fold metallo-hydrolase [Cyanobacteria bacterium UBA8530]|nr:MBL fold metallo-hydrolase [Cyanobacteria bacterium UBA8530]
MIEKEKITIDYLDVGQGDSELIRTPHGQTILIDAGSGSKCVQAVEPMLRNLGIATLDLYVVSHNHADHYGASSLFQTAAVKQVWTPESASEITPLSLLAALGDDAFERLNPRAGYSAKLDGTLLEVLAPENPLFSDENDKSLVLRLTYQNNRFLFPGDAELDSWTQMKNRDRALLEADVLKVAHHGSRNGTNQAVLDCVSPDYAVISCGRGNNYGHPHAETLSLLSGAKVQVFRTDEAGTIRCQSDGDVLRFFAEGTILPSPIPSATASMVGDFLVGNKSSLVFHSPSCRYASQISEQNRQSFASRAEAVMSGYHACFVCGGIASEVKIAAPR